MRRVLVGGLVCLGLAACGGSEGGGNPNGPSPAETRIIFLEGNTDFGDVRVGESVERNLRIYNQGNAPLTVTGMTGPSGYSANWTSGTVPPNNGFQEITFRFSPTENRAYNGTLTVQANHTSGTNTKSFVGRGVRDPFTRNGTGNTVFDMPTDVNRVRITGTYGGRCQNFVVRVGGRLIVNEILGTCSVATTRNYTGEHVVTGGVTEITNSTGVSWTITEIR